MQIGQLFEAKEPFICAPNLKIHLGIRATRAGAAVSVLLALIARCILRLEAQMKGPIVRL